MSAPSSRIGGRPETSTISSSGVSNASARSPGARPSLLAALDGIAAGSENTFRPHS